MELWADQVQLRRLCADLAMLSDVRVCVIGHGGEIICEGSLRPAFCTDMLARGHCQVCSPHESDADCGDNIMLHRCHAGLCTIQAPIRGNNDAHVLAWLCAGPFRDATCDETHVAPEPRTAYLELPELNTCSQEALSGMMEVICDSIRLRTLIRPALQSDLMRLEHYIDEHYMEKISLATISTQLHIGRTRLCSLAKQLSGGDTLTSIIAKKRIAAAKALLTGTNNPVWAVAEAVGISDYNYFSQIFRAAVGISPSQYRKHSRKDAGDREEINQRGEVHQR